MALQIRVIEREELDALAEAASRSCDSCEICACCSCCACCICCGGAVAGTVTVADLVHAPASPLED